MACETRLKPRQTIAERAAEVRKRTAALSEALAAGRVRVVVGKQGAITFAGWADADRDGVSDACAYRAVMARGSTLAKMAIARAEQLAGVTVSRQVVGQGVHSHDGGKTWGTHR